MTVFSYIQPVERNNRPQKDDNGVCCHFDGLYVHRIHDWKSQDYVYEKEGINMLNKNKVLFQTWRANKVAYERYAYITISSF